MIMAMAKLILTNLYKDLKKCNYLKDNIISFVYLIILFFSVYKGCKYK